jgi:hypothetical protein
MPSTPFDSSERSSRKGVSAHPEPTAPVGREGATP